MDSRLLQFLQTLAITRGRRSYAPESNREEDLRSFQDQVDEIDDLVDKRFLNIVGKHRESRTGRRYIDRINIELTREGIEWLARESNTARPTDTGSIPHEDPVNEQIAKLKQDFEEKILSPLRSDLRVQGMNAYEAWKRDFLGFLEQHLPHEVSRFKRLTTQPDTSSQTQKENAYNRFMREEGKTCVGFLETVAEEASASKRVNDGAGHSARVFLSYAREDSAAALKLYKELRAKGLDVWMDTESLLPGQNWKTIIRREIRKSRYFIAVLSGNSVSKKGYVQKELKDALDILEEYPTSSVFLIPARLDNCTPSDDRIRDLHWVDLFEDWEVGIDRILKTIVDSAP